MKNLLVSLFLIFAISNIITAQELEPYIKVGESTASMSVVYSQAITALKAHSFTIIGGYNPSEKSALKVLVFTRKDIKYKVVKVKDRGALAAAFKVGFIKKYGKISISYTNPDYIFRAYLQEDYNTYKGVFDLFSSDLKAALSDLGDDFTSFGGGVKASKLKSYHYKVMMPYFTDPVSLHEFSSFEEGIATIEKNLKAKKGNTIQVYKLVYKSNKVAVFGVGLLDKSTGEPNFLSKIGEDHVAAMPYEIILQDTEATMLNAKYRLALHWPELTMGTFMNIMSTPGDIEETMESLCE